MLEVTSVKVNKIKNNKTIVAFSDITIDNAICIKGIKIINGAKGLFIGMPSVKDKNNEYKDIVYPINTETRKLLTTKILEEYNKSDEPF